MGRPAAPNFYQTVLSLSRARLASTAVILVVCVIASLGVFALVRIWERQSLHAELKVRGTERAEILKAKVLQSAEILYALRSFFATQPAPVVPTRADFHAFVTSTLVRQPEVLALEWVPRVRREQREHYENAARSEGFSNFQFTQKDVDNHLARDAERAEYFPVYYLEPSDRNLRAAGYDILSNDSRRMALEHARDTGELSATAPVLLAQDPDATSSGFLVVLPVYAAESGTVEDRRQNLEGFALAVFKMHDLVNESLSPLAESGVAVELRDQAAATHLYIKAANTSRAAAALATPLHPSVAGLSETFPIDIAGRHWLLALHATPAFAAIHYSWQSWAALLFCLLLTSCLGGYLLTIARHTAFVESRVSRRTAQLSEEIQDRKRAEIAAKRAEEQFRSIFENSIEGIFQTSIDGHYLTANAALARMYGYDTPENLMAALSNIAHELYVDPDRRGAFVRQIETHGAVWDFESQVYRRDRSIIWISENARTVRDAGGNVAYFEGTVVDITARKAAEESLRRAHEDLELRVTQRTAELAAANDALQAEIVVRKRAEETADSANRAKTNFLATMSHEIRTPMNAILGYSQLMARDQALTYSQRQATETILASGNHLMGVVNDILDLSKIESGRVELVESAVDLRALAHGILGMFEHKARQKNLHLLADLPAQRLCVRADEGKLRQVLINLVGNALKFTDAGSVSLFIDARPDGGLSFAVRDTGPGISPREQAQIFEPFCQAEAGRGRGGTGLGLAIARDYVRLMGGNLLVDSAAGEGATFSFTLTLAPELVSAWPEGDAPSDHFTQPLRALVVDDIAENRDVLSAMLIALGCTVHTCDSGPVALSHLDQHTVDVALIDILMPGMDGIELASEIRETDAVFPLLAVTASALSHDRARIKAAGFEELLAKPISVRELAACLRRHCSPSGVPLAPIEATAVSLPEELCAELKSAAATCCTTELKRLLALVPATSAAARRFIRDLHHAITTFNYPAIQKLLDTLPRPELAEQS